MQKLVGMLNVSVIIYFQEPIFGGTILPTDKETDSWFLEKGGKGFPVQGKLLNMLEILKENFPNATELS